MQPTAHVHHDSDWLQDGIVIKATLHIPEGSAGSDWTVTCVSMGNPHAIVYSRDGQDVKVCHAHDTLCVHTALLSSFGTHAVVWSCAEACRLCCMYMHACLTQSDIVVVLHVPVGIRTCMIQDCRQRTTTVHAQLEHVDLPAVGPLFEKHASFPARTNTEFVEVRPFFLCTQILFPSHLLHECPC